MYSARTTMEGENDHIDALTDEIPGFAQLPALPEYRDPYEGNEDLREARKRQGYYGVMYAGEYAWDNLRCTQEAYGDMRYTPGGRSISGQNRRSLQFHTTWCGVERAAECLRVIESYNRFEGDLVADTLTGIDEPMVVAVGRESSPVVYVFTTAPRTVMDALDTMRVEIDGIEEYGKLAGVDPVDTAPRMPDELGTHLGSGPHYYPTRTIGNQRNVVSDDTPGLIRAWWD